MVGNPKGKALAKHSGIAMCHLIFFSTDCEDDLLDTPQDNYRIERPPQKVVEELEPLLAHKNTWYMGCRYGGCSCHFRNLLKESASLGFGEPEEWFKEEEDDFGPTIAAFEFFEDLIKRGHKVDVHDVWADEIPAKAKTVKVSVSKLPPSHFRFIQNLRFEFVS